MPQFFLFGPQVSKGVRRWRGFARNLDDDLDAGINQRAGFVAVIRENPDSTEAQVVQDRGRQTEIAAISHDPQYIICFNRIQTAVLQRVSLQLRRQADATALLMCVDQQPADLLSNGLHGQLQLVPTVTPQRPEHLAREALRMDAHQRNARRHIAQNKRHRGLNPVDAVESIALEPQRSKHSPSRRHSGGSNSSNYSELGGCFHIGPSRGRDLLRCYRSWFGCWRGWARDDAARTQALNLFRVEPEFFENFVVVFSQLRRSLCRYFRDAVHLNGTTDRKLQAFSGAFEWDDYVVSL